MGCAAIRRHVFRQRQIDGRHAAAAPEAQAQTDDSQRRREQGHARSVLQARPVAALAHSRRHHNSVDKISGGTGQAFQRASSAAAAKSPVALRRRARRWTPPCSPPWPR